MIKVYFQTVAADYSELVATFDTEELYNLCLPALEAEAKKNRMIVTESVVDDEKEFFDVIRVHREDLMHQGMSKDVADKLTDPDMQRIADKISDGIMESGVFWDSVDNIVEDYK